MPYGGVKRSGIGREGPRYAIEAFSHSLDPEPTYVPLTSGHSNRPRKVAKLSN